MKRLLFYLAALLVFGVGLWMAFTHGESLPRPENSLLPNAVASSSIGHASAVEPSASLFANLRAHLQDPLSRLLIQLILIVAMARLCGGLAVKCGQPAVIGEIVAGIALGPSLLGWVWPEFMQAAFPPTSLGSLRLFSQIGVCRQPCDRCGDDKAFRP